MDVVSFKTISRSRYITSTQLHQLKLGLANRDLVGSFGSVTFKNPQIRAPFHPLLVLLPSTLYFIRFLSCSDVCNGLRADKKPLETGIVGKKQKVTFFQQLCFI